MTVQQRNAVGTMDPVLMAVLANRFDTICREMTNTLVRTGRSAVVALARDFSCSIVTADNQLLAYGESCPVHVLGPRALTETMTNFHPDLKEGDAFLHNDSYLGNTHSADHTILVPVFFEGEHVFTASAKAHMADCGNSVPTTYHAEARDVYEEGAIVFPCVKVQQGYEDVDDIIRMAKRRIRVPEVWYGDYLAVLGAARVAEREIKALLGKYGLRTVREFVRSWFDYSEVKMAKAIQELGTGSFVGHGQYDSFGSLEEGIPLTVKVEIDGEEGRITVDLRDNPDNVAAGVNESETCALSNVMTGVFNSIDPDIPHNDGSMRRVEVLMRDGCVVGRPTFPTSCSVATTNVGDRLVNITQSAFADFTEHGGGAEAGTGMPPGSAVISGYDRRRDMPYVNQTFFGSQGGGANCDTDGWLTFLLPVTAGVLYRDSVEVAEDKYPIVIKEMRVLTDTGGAGFRRGAPGSRVVYGPTHDPMRAVYIGDGHETAPRGVKGGKDGIGTSAAKVSATGEELELPNQGEATIEPDAWIVGVQSSGGGYGDPLEREPERVLTDVYERFVSVAAAREEYGVVIVATDDPARRLEVDLAATEELRRTRGAA